MVDRYPGNSLANLPLFFRQQDSEAFSVLQKFFSAFDLETAEWNKKLDELDNIRSLSTVSESDLQFKAANTGTSLPTFFPSTVFRSWIRQLPRFYKRKQNHSTIVDAIRTVLNISVTITNAWNDETKWSIGTDEIGIDTFIGGGELYEAADPKASVINSMSISDTRIGVHGTNPRLPRTFKVFLNIIPTQSQLDSINFIVQLLKPAEEHYTIITPTIGTCWLISESTSGLDTTLCAKCWFIGVSKIDISSVVCGDTDTEPIEFTIITAENTLLPPPGVIDVSVFFILTGVPLLPEVNDFPSIEPILLFSS